MNVYKAMQLASALDEKINRFNSDVKHTGVNISKDSFSDIGVIIKQYDDCELILTYEGDLKFSFEGSSSGEGGFYSGDMKISFKHYQSLRIAFFANFEKQGNEK